MVAIPVNSEVLVWAREERGLTLAEAAARLDVPEADVIALEFGKKAPTLGELERLSTHYRIPLASLLMPAPLAAVTRPKMADFRAFDGHQPKRLSPETILAIEEVFEIAEGLADLREADAGYRRVPPPPQYKLSDDPETVAIKERKRLALSIDEQMGWAGNREAFLRWRELVEAQGVYTYQLKLGADNTRGFALFDEREIPIIVVDFAEEGYQAKIFTVWHEYAHILLRMGHQRPKQKK